MGPKGEPGARGPAGPPGYPQNSIFASFSAKDLIIQESAWLPLPVEISDITRNISACDDCCIVLTPGYYAVSCYICTVLEKRGFVKVTPIYNGCRQTNYTTYGACRFHVCFRVVLFSGCIQNRHESEHRKTHERVERKEGRRCRQ